MTSEPFEEQLTNRLALRCVTASDALATSLLMTPNVSQWLASWPTPFTSAMAGARINAMRELAFLGQVLPFAITARADGELLGWAIIERHDTDQGRASLGFWLGEAHQSKGYMREAAPTLIAAGFRLLRVDVIEAGAQPANAGSFAVMAACGMRLIGDRMVHASARSRDELCRFYEVWRQFHPTPLSNLRM